MTKQKCEDIYAAFFYEYNISEGHSGFAITHEHGQAWIIHNPSGASWSVVETDSPDGIGFECLGYGEEEYLFETGYTE